jgi:hypothetical protein
VPAATFSRASKWWTKALSTLLTGPMSIPSVTSSSNAMCSNTARRARARRGLTMTRSSPPMARLTAFITRDDGRYESADESVSFALSQSMSFQWPS